MDQRELQLTQMLGKTVHVEVDRPMGYRHGDILYPVNYGYIPGMLGGDGEAQDAYILGVEQPLTHFYGRVIGAIRRWNDREDKLVVAPEGLLLHQGEIAQAVRFQEQYFSTSVLSLLRRSCGVIPFRRVGHRLEVLVLLQNSQCWSFPKGHMEPGESEQDTALRELREETGLTGKLLPKLQVCLEYNLSPQVRKQVVLFPGQVQGELRLQSSEILEGRWVAPEELEHCLHPDSFLACKPLIERL